MKKFFLLPSSGTIFVFVFILVMYILVGIYSGDKQYAVNGVIITLVSYVIVCMSVRKLQDDYKEKRSHKVDFNGLGAIEYTDDIYEVEDRTLWNFVRMQDGYEEKPRLAHKFLFNGVWCYAKEERLPDHDRLIIQPMNYIHDIGKGPGIPIIKHFRKY